MSRTDWTADWRTAEVEQRALSALVETTPLALKRLRRCWALGVAYSEVRRLAVAVGLRCHLDGRTVDKEVHVATQEVTFPYVPGLFAYREGPALTALLDGLGERPELAIMDVQGIAHPRGIGLAAHVGALYDIPTIGITRKRLWGRHDQVPDSAGAIRPLRANGRTIGWAYRRGADDDLVFASPGHKTDDETVRTYLSNLATTRRSIPTALDLAHRRANDTARRARQ